MQPKIVEVIKRIRQSYGISQDEVAQAVGYSRNYISILENRPLESMSIEMINRLLSPFDKQLIYTITDKVKESEKPA